MIKNKKIAVVIPAYNEGNLIDKVIETMPKFVDALIIINDCSTDDTKERIKTHQRKNKKIKLINHKKNQGLGQTLIDGYLYSLKEQYDVTAVMAGDAQMDPEDLRSIVLPIVEKEADYTKGYRLLYENVKNIMPKYRFLGNGVLTLLTKFATGYWHLIDPQCGYTAISYDALLKIPIQDMTKGYGYNADILNMLNLTNCTVKDVPVRPVYGDEKSKIKLFKYIFKTSFLLVKLFNKRMWKKYLVRDFNPLVFFYYTSIFSTFFVFIPMLIRFLTRVLIFNELPKTTALICFLAFFMSTQFLFFGIWMDMEDNKKLRR